MNEEKDELVDDKTEAENETVPEVTDQRKLDDLLAECNTVTEVFNLILKNWTEFPKKNSTNTCRSTIKSMPIPTALFALSCWDIITDLKLR